VPCRERVLIAETLSVRGFLGMVGVRAKGKVVSEGYGSDNLIDGVYQVDSKRSVSPSTSLSR
jgi:hypothetical protein